MQVFKLYWKLLRANMRAFFIYLSIFTGLLFGVIIPNQTKSGAANYVGTRCSFAVLDEDQSDVSKAVIEYLAGVHDQKDLDVLDTDTIQDELFYQNIDAVLMIPAGFGKALEDGNADTGVQIRVVAGTIKGSLFEQDYNSYVSKLAAYMDGGFSAADAIEKTAEACNMEMPVQFLEGKDTSGHTPEYSFFVYLVWVFVAMCIQSVAPVLGIMDKKEVKNRVYFSSYKFSAFNREIVLAAVLTGLIICGFYLALAVVVLGVAPFTIRGGLWTLNMLCIMVVAMGFTLLVSRISTKDPVIAAMSNIISLGMSFICGVFVPMEYLGEGVLKAAHFLPAYWYVQAVDLIGEYTPDKLGTIFSYMGVELLFAAALMAVAFMISRRKNV